MAELDENKQQLVDQILDQIALSGEKVSLRGLIERVGEETISSTSTMSKYKTNWEQRRHAKELELYDKLGFSSEFSQAFMSEISRFTTQVETQSRTHNASLRADKLDLESELERLEIKHSELQAVANQKEKSITELNQLIDKLKLENSHSIESQKKDFQHKIETLEAKYQGQLDALAKQNEESRSNIESLTITIDTLRRQLAQADLKLEGLEGLQHTNNELIGQIKELNQELSDNKASTVGVRTELEASAKQISMMEKNFEKELSASEKEIEVLRSARSNQDDLVIILREEVATRKGQIETLASQINQLNQQLSEERKLGK